MTISVEENKRWLDWMDSVRCSLSAYPIEEFDSPLDYLVPCLEDVLKEPFKNPKTEISEYAYKNGEDINRMFSAFLGWALGLFDVNNTFHLSEIIPKEKEKNSFFVKVLAHWLKDMQSVFKGYAPKTGKIGRGWHDWFGAMYEEGFQSKGKADMLGQFYTPEDLCCLVGEITSDKQTEDCIISDPCCGSGRLLLSRLPKADDRYFNYYIGTDIDMQSVQMCALNMMVHGMKGCVLCLNSLTQKEFRGGWEINEVQYPIKTPFFSVRKLTEEDVRIRLTREGNTFYLKNRMMYRAIKEREGKRDKNEPFAVHYDESRHALTLSNPPFGAKLSKEERESIMNLDFSDGDCFWVVPEEEKPAIVESNGQMSLNF